MSELHCEILNNDHGPHLLNTSISVPRSVGPLDEMVDLHGERKLPSMLKTRIYAFIGSQRQLSSNRHSP